jgi:hypothetical protein
VPAYIIVRSGDPELRQQANWRVPDHNPPFFPPPPPMNAMSSKRGRKRNDALPPNRARDVQRAFRARRAAHLEALELRVILLEDENERLRRALSLPPADRPSLGTGPTGRQKSVGVGNGGPRGHLIGGSASTSPNGIGAGLELSGGYDERSESCSPSPSSSTSIQTSAAFPPLASWPSSNQSTSSTASDRMIFWDPSNSPSDMHSQSQSIHQRDSPIISSGVDTTLNSDYPSMQPVSIKSEMLPPLMPPTPIQPQLQPPPSPQHNQNANNPYWVTHPSPPQPSPQFPTGPLSAGLVYPTTNHRSYSAHDFSYHHSTQSVDYNSLRTPISSQWGQQNGPSPTHKRSVTEPKHSTMPTHAAYSHPSFLTSGPGTRLPSPPLGLIGRYNG